MEDKYSVDGVSLVKIRNKNELRVIALMPEVLKKFELDFSPNTLDIQDIFALTLSNLPPRYVQRGSIILNEDVTNEMIREQIRAAIMVVSDRPKH